MANRSKSVLFQIICASLFIVNSGLASEKPLISKIYCYESLTTLTEDTPTGANCFEVSNAGLVSRVFHGEQMSEGHIYPGIWDGHGHLLQYGELLQSVNLFGSVSLHHALSNVKIYAAAHPKAGSKDEWIRGVGWDQAAFGRMPTAASADFNSDDQLKGKYIMLDRVDVHCIWVSESVLSLLPSPFPEVPGGEVIIDPGPGVFCDNAMDAVMQHWPKPDKAKKVGFIKAAQKALNGVGLVGMHDAGVVPENLELYQELASTEDWTVRVYAMLECQKRNTFCGNDVQTFEHSSGMLSMKNGALGSWGSAMIEPYSDKPSTKGSLLVQNASTLTQLAKNWSQAGYQVNIHAIGDLANRYAIDAFQAAFASLCPDLPAKDCQAKHRFRIEHAQIIHPDDQKRMVGMGIIPSIQPTHATSDMVYAKDRLGSKRTNEEAYRMRSLVSLSPVLGSDFPVEPPNPFEGIFAAVARKSPRTGLGRNGTDNGWHVEEALGLEDALKGFTLGPAYGAFLEGQTGVLKQGAFADWIVLDERLEDLTVDELRHVSVRETWVGGRRVYSREVEQLEIKDEL